MAHDLDANACASAIQLPTWATLQCGHRLLLDDPDDVPSSQRCGKCGVWVRVEGFIEGDGQWVTGA